MEFRGLDPEQARAFAARWLPACTGNDRIYRHEVFFDRSELLGAIAGAREPGS